MDSQQGLERYFSIVSSRRLLSRQVIAKGYLGDLFSGVGLAHSRALDIGGGSGVCSFYMAIQGARHVVCLEPGADGSNSTAFATFNAIRAELAADNVALLLQTLQKFDPGDERFDVVLLHNSINHLDETACQALLTDPHSRDRYRAVFQKLYDISALGATLIVCDCARSNFFNRIGVRNPLARTIEWDKHQAPETWAALLQEVGFADPHIQWTSFGRMGKVGRFVIGNPYSAYFLTSHFCLKMVRR